MSCVILWVAVWQSRPTFERRPGANLICRTTFQHLGGYYDGVTQRCKTVTLSRAALWMEIQSRADVTPAQGQIDVAVGPAPHAAASPSNEASDFGASVQRHLAAE